MTKIEAFKSICQMMYGENWESEVSKALCFDKRRLKHWESGIRPIPIGIWFELAGIIQEKKKLVDDALKLYTEEMKKFNNESEFR
jgi:hypothetical protein